MIRAVFAAVAVLVAASLIHSAPAPETDPVLIGSKWKGKVTQRGTFASGGKGPPEFGAVLTITKRDRNTFEAELHETAEAESLSITYLVRGEITRDKSGKGYLVIFRSFDAKDAVNTVPILNIPYSGNLSSGTMKGTWKIPKNDNGIDIEGDFKLELIVK